MFVNSVERLNSPVYSAPPCVHSASAHFSWPSAVRAPRRNAPLIRNFFNERIVIVHGTQCLLMSTFPSCRGSKKLLGKSIFHSFCSVMSCNHLVRFWQQCIFYYCVCVFFCVFSLPVMWLCVCVLVGLLRVYILILPFVLSLWAVVGAAFLSSPVWIATACGCWLLEQNKTNEWIYCLLVYIVCFPTYPFFFTFSLLVSSLTCLFLWE